MGDQRVLTAHLLGGFQLLWGGLRLPPIASRQARSLLAYLLMYRHQAHTRERLAGLFWPDLDESRARRRLSQTLWQIQTALADVAPNERFLDTDADLVSLRADIDVWVDVHRFQQLVAEATDGQRSRTEVEALLSRAIELYHGDFMAGSYDDWVFADQSRLREAYLDSLMRLSRVHRSRGAYEHALSFAFRVVIHEPLRETAHREVMRLLSLLGRFSEALEQYETCERILEVELAVAPSDATVALRKRITELAQDPTAGPAPVASPNLYGESDAPMVGRSLERSRMVEALDAALAGAGQVVFVEGPAGIGKTRLLKEMANDAHWRGLSVLAVGFRRELVDEPAGGLLEGMRALLTPARWTHLEATVDEPWIGELRRLFPGLARQSEEPFRGSPEQRAELINEAIAQAVVKSAGVQPLVLVLDDVHNANNDTWRLLELLASRTGQTSLVVVMAYRAQEARADPFVWNRLREIDRAHHPTRLLLDALTVRESTELVRRWFRAESLPQTMADLVVKETGGNPLFLLETLRELSDRTILASADDDDHRLLPIPDSIEEVVVRRLDLLTARERLVAGVVAVLREFCSFPQIVATCGLPTSAVAADIVTLLERGFLTERDALYRISHDQVRTVVEQHLPAAEQRAFHAAFAAWLDIEAEDDWYRRAVHHRRAGNASMAAACFEQAGDRAQNMGAYASAVSAYLESVTTTTDSDLDLHALVLLKLERAAHVLGDRQTQHRALEHLDTLLDIDPVHEVEANTRSAVLAAHEGHVEHALEAIDRTIDTDRFEQAPAQVRAETLHAKGIILQLAGEHSEALQHLRSAKELAGSDRQPDIAIDTAASLRALGRYDDTWTALDSAYERFAASDDWRAADVLRIGGAVFMEQGRLEEALQRQLECVRLSERIGYRRGMAIALLNSGNTYATLGHIEPALSFFESAAETFREIADPAGLARARANAANALVEYCGDWKRAAEAASEAADYFAAVGDTSGLAQCRGIQALATLHAGHPARAVDLAGEALDLAEQTGRPWAIQHAGVLRQRVVLASGDVRHVVDRLRASEGAGGSQDVVLAGAYVEAGMWTDAARVVTALEAAKLSKIEQIETELLASLTAHALDDDSAGERARNAKRLMEDLLDTAGAELAEQARLGHPLFRRVEDHFMRLHVVRRPLRAPHKAAPLGRPLTEIEVGETDVIVSAPDDFAIHDSRERRRHRLARVLKQLDAEALTASIPQLAELMAVSVSTVRRDLQALRAIDPSVRTRGHRATHLA